MKNPYSRILLYMQNGNINIRLMLLVIILEVYARYKKNTKYPSSHLLNRNAANRTMIIINLRDYNLYLLIIEFNAITSCNHWIWYNRLYGWVIERIWMEFKLQSPLRGKFWDVTIIETRRELQNNFHIKILLKFYYSLKIYYSLKNYY